MHSVLFFMYISLQVKQLLVGLFWTASKVTHKLEWDDIANSLCLKHDCPLCLSERVDCTS